MSNYYREFEEDSDGNLIDVAYYHRFCAPQALKDQGDQPCCLDNGPDYAIYCANPDCGELIREATEDGY